MTDPTKLGTPFEAQFHAGRAQEWIIQRMIRQLNTAQLVTVVAVHPTAGTVGFVDLRPMVQQQTVTGTVIESGTIFRAPYLRAQGGVSAVILDPAVGDIGLAVCTQRDSTAVITTKADAPAATNRAYDLGDSLYVGAFLNADPAQFLEFLPDAAGIRLVTPGDLTIEAGGNLAATVGGDLSLTVAGSINVSAASTTWAGPVTFADPITAPEATVGGIAFTTHKHTSASPGTPTSTPIP